LKRLASAGGYCRWWGRSALLRQGGRPKCELHHTRGRKFRRTLPLLQW